LAAVDVRVPRPGTPPDAREMYEWWNDITNRTGGATDKVDSAATTADTALTTAELAETNAALSLAQVQALAQATASEVKTINFLRYWI
jgi:hypothetical protein